MSSTFTEVYHPSDPTYMMKRQRQINELMSLNEAQLKRQINYLLQQPGPRDESGAVTKSFLTDLKNSPVMPQSMKGILDSTGGTTGNVLIRQDLEAPLYTLFVKKFPFWERIEKGPSNGLVHAANQITAPDAGALGSSVITELGTVSYASSTYQRATFPIAVFAQGRGVSLKEIAAVQQGGAPYDPSKQELADGIVRLSTDIQYMMFQGNATNSSGQSASTEGGAYNANGIDGLRGVLGSVGSFNTNSAIQVDVGSLNLTESIQAAAAKSANNGGNPSAVVLTINAKQVVDIENANNRRYNDNTIEIIPGVQCNQIAYANGMLTLIPVPGNTLGTYNRTSDSALVEDIYILDESTVKGRWLYSEGFTTLQIPSGVDGVLSDRWIVFAMYGIEIAAPLYCAKVRRLAS
jgi:hypothetical protein